MDAVDRQGLRDFLDELCRLIEDILAEEHAHWFPPELARQLRNTWRNEVSRMIETVKAGIDDPSNETMLDAHGLSGDQLRLKLDAWRSAERGARQGPLATTPRRRWRRMLEALGLTLKPLQGALKIANAILGSIGKAIPAAGAVEEFKKILEGSLDVDDGRGPLKRLRDRLRRS